MHVDEDNFEAWLQAGYPRPQLCRSNWVSLNGTWDLVPDPDDQGRRSRWQDTFPEDVSTVKVPFPIGSEMSQIDTVESDIYWYRRTISPTEIEKAGEGETLRINFEATDYLADVWIDGLHAAHHEGGYTPFAASIDYQIVKGGCEIIVRCEDRLDDISKPRGKQDWRTQPHGIWYQQSIGIWRDVWMERIPSLALEQIWWTSDLNSGTVQLSGTIAGRPVGELQLSLELFANGSRIVSQTSTISGGPEFSVTAEVGALRNKHEWDQILWSPTAPNLVDAKVTLRGGEQDDCIVSYLGIRDVDVTDGYLRINRAPHYQRGVLDQGYWAESFFTAPNGDALEQEARLAQALGFNMVRIHERSADQRYLAWADRLGLMIWAESASAYAFDSTAISRTVDQWLELIQRDRSHPSIVVWVPFNESWGVPSISSRVDQRCFVEALVKLTHAVDPTRPVISNDGWEQTDTDIITIHDYALTDKELLASYGSKLAAQHTVLEAGPQGRAVLLSDEIPAGTPIIVSEFGGIALAAATESAWGYGVAPSPAEFHTQLKSIFGALYQSPVLAGFCYTQLTDTGQEINGLCYANREPKLPAEVIHNIVTDNVAHLSQARPRVIRETTAFQEEQ